MHGVKIRRVWIAHIKEHQSQWLGAAAVVAAHFHVRRHRYGLTSFHCDWLPTLHFQRERALQYINSHRQRVSMEQGLIARPEARRETTYLRLLPMGPPLH